MPLKKLWVVAVLAATIAPWQTASADRSPPEIFPLSKVKRGQTGYGMTTFAGTTPERFTFEVLGVNRNFLPKMDIILVRSDDPKLEVPGFWRGMSGSPLFIDGKLACAFSYGFRFNKLAIGGCTPIEYMIEQGFVSRRHKSGAANPPVRPAAARRTAKTAHARRARRATPRILASLDEWQSLAPEGTVDSALYHMSPPRKPWLLRTPLPHAPKRPGARTGETGMEPSALPLALSGFTPSAYEEAKRLMAGYPLEPMRAGGTGDANSGPSAFEMGAPIAVQLIRGDMGAAATGTVSYVDGNRVLAFGHPMFQAGEIYAPVAAAEIHTVIPSAANGFILSSPLRELGSLVQDRQSAVMADTSLKTGTIPVHISIERSPDQGGEAGEFDVEVFDNRFFTASLAGVVASNAISRFLPDRDRATVYMESTVYMHGHEPLHFVDYLYGERGAGEVIGGCRGLRVLAPLLLNPFEPVEIERVELKAKVNYGTNYGEIDSLRLPTTELAPGKRNYVDVLMKTYDGEDFVERVPFDVPADLAGSIVRLQVVAGDSAGVDAAPPKTLDDLLAAFHKLMPGNVLVVILFSADEGIAIDGKLVRDLPASAIDRFKPATSTPKADTYRPASRSSYPSTRVVDGTAKLLVKVAEE